MLINLQADLLHLPDMIEPGKFHQLTVKSSAPQGLYLTDGSEDILLPKRFVPASLNIGDTAEVFVYLDNENRPVATTEKPYANINEFAFLKVKDVTNAGAFLDWGISKDLFVAFSEQRFPMVTGESYLVYIFFDERSGRIAATSKWSSFLEKPYDYEAGDEVELIIAEKTDLGYRAIIDNRCEGLLYADEVFENLKAGDRRRGYIRLVRDDGKVDLRLQPEGYASVENAADIIMDYLEKHNGVLNLGDKSPAEKIYSVLKMSKKNFKKSIGALYKKRLVVISDEEVRLVNEVRSKK